MAAAETYQQDLIAMQEAYSQLRAERDALRAALAGFLWLEADYCHGHNAASARLAKNIALAKALTK